MRHAMKPSGSEEGLARDDTNDHMGRGQELDRLEWVQANKVSQWAWPWMTTISR